MHHSTAAYTKDALIEQPAIRLLADFGWETANCFDKTFGPSGTLGRETPIGVVLCPRLHAALQRLNPDAPTEAIDTAIEQLACDRSTLSAIHINREIHQLLKNGVKVLSATAGSVSFGYSERVAQKDVEWALEADAKALKSFEVKAAE